MLNMDTILMSLRLPDEETTAAQYFVIFQEQDEGNYVKLKLRILEKRLAQVFNSSFHLSNDYLHEALTIPAPSRDEVGDCDLSTTECESDDDETEECKTHLEQKYGEWSRNLDAEERLYTTATKITKTLGTIQRLVQEGERTCRDFHLAKMEDEHTQQEKANQMAALKGAMEPFLFVNDAMYVRLERADDAALVDVFTNDVGGLREFLIRLDIHSASLEVSSHPDKAKYIEKYESLRRHLCMKIQDILIRSWEKSERYLTTQIVKCQRALQMNIDKQSYLSRLTKAALTKEDAQNLSDEDDDPMGLGGDESSSFVPARWFFIKFRAYAVNVHPLTSLLSDRAHSTKHEIYRSTLERLHGNFAALRMRFLGKSFERQIQHMLNRHSKIASLDIAVRQCTSFWLSIANYEVELYHAYFGKSHGVKTCMALVLRFFGGLYYDIIRPRVLKCQDFELIRDLYDAITVDVIEVRAITLGPAPTPRHQELESLKLAPIHRIQRDLQERLLLRIEHFMSTEISAYPIRDEHLDYPKLLLSADSETRRDLYHPIVTRCLDCLSQICPVLEQTVLRNLAYEIVTTTLEKLNEAVARVDALNGSNRVDALLFGLRQLLHVKTRLQSLNFSTVRTARSLSFSKLRFGIANLFHSLTDSSSKSAGRFGGFLSVLTPDLQEQELDAKEALNSKIDEWIETIITCVVGGIIMPLMSSAGEIGRDKLNNPEVAKDNTDLEAGVNKALEDFWANLSTVLPTFVCAVGLYINGVDVTITENFLSFQEARTLITQATPAAVRSMEEMSIAQSSWESEFEAVNVFLDPTRVAVCEAYRQYLSILHRAEITPEGQLSPPSIRQVDATIRMCFENYSRPAL